VFKSKVSQWNTWWRFDKIHSSMFHVEQIHRFLNYNESELNYKMFLNEYDGCYCLAPGHAGSELQLPFEIGSKLYCDNEFRIPQMSCNPAMNCKGQIVHWDWCWVCSGIVSDTAIQFKMLNKSMVAMRHTCSKWPYAFCWGVENDVGRDSKSWFLSRNG
jgi:hypothetical protein